MKEIQLNEQMQSAADLLNEGPVLIAYLDDGQIRMETRDGEDPYVWRDEAWRPMKN